MSHFTRFEGGQIGIDGDRATAVEWYCRHLGLSVVFDSAAEGQTLLRFPQRHAIPLVSTSGGTERSLWPSAGGVATREANVRLALAASDVTSTRAQLEVEGVRVGPVRKGPGGLETFDLWDLEGTRLMAVAMPSQIPSGGGRISGYAPPRIGVRDLQRSLTWYEYVLNTNVLQVQAVLRRALLELGDFLPIWLQELPPERFTGNQIAYARLFVLAPEIETAHAWCVNEGLDPSPLLGMRGDLRLFHIFDPDGNAIGAWTYPGASGKG